jgi:hypothetical protein
MFDTVQFNVEVREEMTFIARTQTVSVDLISLVTQMSQLSWKYKDLRYQECECRGNVVEMMSLVVRKAKFD